MDDTEDNRDLYAMLLEGLGYDVAVAVDGYDGVMLAQAIRPAVILMDLAMPNLDGFDATRQIRETPELANVHIIAVTAFADPQSTQRALACGCDEVLTKPCSPSLLTARVANGVRATRAPRSQTSSRPSVPTPSTRGELRFQSRRPPG